ncbi:MAG: hypothetical protein AAFP81_08455 [Pseudomonadota bacterium]
MRWIGFLFLLLVVACGAPSEPPALERPEILPDQFALLPCDEAIEDRPCALAIAGGKRLLFGTPGSVVLAVSTEDLRQLDAVIVFSLRAGDLEGLDDVRNASWRAGRDAPLIVVGPPGIDDVVAALNKAYEQSDALRIVEEGIPPGGYDAALLEARVAIPSSKVFDTGDLQVHRQTGGYEITYDGMYEAFLSDCRSGARDGVNSHPEAATATKTITISCRPDDFGLSWPLTAPLFVSEK